MLSKQVGGRELSFNEKGYLADFAAWDEEVAEAIAKEDGLVLTDCHWAAIRYMREHFAELGVAAPPRKLSAAVGHDLAKRGPCTRRTLEALFPNGGCRQLCRVAGLPDYYCHTI
jgi:dissimilatory sulfite reductase related protein